MKSIHKDMMASNANANTTSTGMTLRNGKVIQWYNNTVGTPQGIQLDGDDYVPLAHLKDFNWDWQRKVHTALSQTADWTPESSYEFLQYLTSTSQHWCSVVWNDRTSQDGHDFGHFLMGLIDEFKEDAEYSLKYPNTRSADEWKQEYFGWWKGTVRLANEILMEWNVCERMFADPANYSYAGEAGDNNMVIDLTADSDSEDEDLNAAVAPGGGDADNEYDYEEQSGYGHA